jgi:phage portal protein BeeE
MFTCIAILADAVATLPHIAYKRTRDRGKQVIDPTSTLIANPWADGDTQRVKSD